MYDVYNHFGKYIFGIKFINLFLVGKDQFEDLVAASIFVIRIKILEQARF